MTATDQRVSDLERLHAAAKADRERLETFRRPNGLGGFMTMQPWVLDEARRQEQNLANALEYARTGTIDGQPFNPPQHKATRPQPVEDPVERANRIRASRRRRLAQLEERIAREAPRFEPPTGPLDHGDLSRPGRLNNIDRDLDHYKAHQKDIQERDHLAQLLAKETTS
ncbi:hypothetical protein [Kocuria sp.]|uniref:hypothetical protein n=1 Tax=Kocuria sp. TaxID=1871328 RepID=UPI0026E0B9E1|nr:hypothetical protein [Kocuria sp.]MDO5619297.1 hypothetical protein [Kocuria sp.]